MGDHVTISTFQLFRMFPDQEYFPALIASRAGLLSELARRCEAIEAKGGAR